MLRLFGASRALDSLVCIGFRFVIVGKLSAAERTFVQKIGPDDFSIPAQVKSNQPRLLTSTDTVINDKWLWVKTNGIILG